MEKLKKILVGQDILALSRSKKVLWFLGVVFMIVCLVSVELYLDRSIDSQTNSDASSELILSSLLAKEGKIVTPNWYYSTEIRLLNTNLVFSPLFRIFHDWHKIRLCGSIILHLVLLLSIYTFCRKTQITVFFPAVGLMLLLPFSGEYFYNFLRFPYYIPHIVITLFIFALVIWYSENNSSKVLDLVILLISGAVSLLAGMGGARQVIVCFLPLFIAVFFPWLRNRIKTPAAYPDRKWNKYLLIVTLCIIAGCIGYILNTKVLVKSYHYCIYEVSFAGFDADRMFTAIGGLLQSLGYISGKFGGRVVFHNATAVLLLAGSVVFAFRGIKAGWRTSNAYFFFSCFYISSIAVFVLLFAFTDMVYEERYNLPVIVLAAPMIAMGLRYLNDFRRVFRTIVLLVWCGVIAFSGYDYLAGKGINEEKTNHQLIADFLVDHGYYEGYATFWNANILTELSDG